MEIIEQIEKEVAKLDYAWYQAMKERFEREGLYNKGLGKVYDEISETYNDDKLHYRKVDISLEQYCWDKNNNPYTSFPAEQYPDIFNAKSIITAVINLIHREVHEYSDNNAKHNYIELVKKKVSEVFREYDSKHGAGNDYSKAIWGIYDLFTKALYRKFGNAKREYELGNHIEDRLEFKIPKEQVAALMYLLSKAGILNTTSEYDKSYRDFCEKYFYYPNRRNNGKYEKCKDLGRKSGDIINNDSPSVKMLSKKLKAVIPK